MRGDGTIRRVGGEEGKDDKEGGDERNGGKKSEGEYIWRGGGGGGKGGEGGTGGRNRGGTRNSVVHGRGDAMPHRARPCHRPRFRPSLGSPLANPLANHPLPIPASLLSHTHPPALCPTPFCFAFTSSNTPSLRATLHFRTPLVSRHSK